MPLIAFWNSSREQVLGLSLEQIVKNSGDGRLRDGAESSKELRQFLSEIPTEKLGDYTEQCLAEGFDKSGFALQDIVNEIGGRLGFRVEPGLYHGRRDRIGFDGIWRHAGEPEIVVEVKTTDYYSVNLDKLNSYRERLAAAGNISRKASFLVVVGRDDTNSLEAQIRGSRYAWDMRLVSVDALVRSVLINEKSDSVDTANKIRQILRPIEYTRVDRIIELVFTTAEEVESSQEIQSPPSDVIEVEGQTLATRGTLQIDRTPQFMLDAHRQLAVDGFAQLKHIRLLKRGRRLFIDDTAQVAVCCLISKRYDNQRHPYWYGFSPKMDEAIQGYKNAFVVIACLDRREAYAVPYKAFRPVLDQVNKSMLNGRLAHWQVQLTSSEYGKMAVAAPRGSMNLDLSPYAYTF
jgi:hypothetical protein